MIRQATERDVKWVSPLIVQCMGHLASIFSQSDTKEDAESFFSDFFVRKDNQYSYLNALVYENQGKVTGVVLGYDGALLPLLRQPVLDRIRQVDAQFTPGDETEAGEFYLDCLSVHSEAQGRGIGKVLIESFCDLARSRGFDHVGLIVEKQNPDALRLYQKSGFSIKGEKGFMGGDYFHLVHSLRITPVTQTESEG